LVVLGSIAGIASTGSHPPNCELMLSPCYRRLKVCGYSAVLFKLERHLNAEVKELVELIELTELS
jgi:hypothetical protein